MREHGCIKLAFGEICSFEVEPFEPHILRGQATRRASGIVERVGCRVADAPDQLTWASVWRHALRADLTDDPRGAIGRHASVTYTHRTAAGALREARLTTLA